MSSVSSATLPALPTELLTQIFTLSTALDSGKTLRSLLHVSRRFYNICAPLKFHCVTLTTSLGVTRFYQELERCADAPTHLRRILHLYISLSLSNVHADAERDIITQLFCIIQTAAETLQTLTLTYHNTLFSTSVFGRLFRQSFPVLVELTIHGFYPFPSPMSPNELPAPTPSSDFLPKAGSSFMPMLERLHLGGNRNPYGLLQLSSLDKCFPRLTHLAVSGLLMAASFVEEIKSALDEHLARRLGPKDTSCTNGSIALGGTLARLPSGLQSLVLQPGFMPLVGLRPGITDSAEKKDSRMMAGLKEVEEAEKRGRGVVRVMLKDRMQTSDQVSINSGLYSDWLDRMNGARGYW
ncbi:hypothetical protein BDP27DRAFT_1309570 [Rhodocollybia butyracea]|uniref:F-box domain-containing protein n=1 Tax=Rhodocollybia butyracea TaxID=206335 RepID=A0A9P5QAU2_9AGAR|nr:hypothetical protein BDP27DRAFT_1309570 [Rhodocollybia butyracea]